MSEMQKECANCGKWFEVNKFHPNDHKCCSLRCRSNFYYESILKQDETQIERCRIRARDRYIINKSGKSCKNCGSDDKLEFHHSDYSKAPIILCRNCHYDVHFKKDLIK